MKIFTGPRRSGRTKWILEQAAGKNGTIVSANAPMCDYIRRRAARGGIEINPPITHAAFLRGPAAPGPFWIDDAEWLIRVLHPNIGGFAAIDAPDEPYPRQAG